MERRVCFSLCGGQVCATTLCVLAHGCTLCAAMVRLLNTKSLPQPFAKSTLSTRNMKPVKNHHKHHHSWKGSPLSPVQRLVDCINSLPTQYGQEPGFILKGGNKSVCFAQIPEAPLKDSLI